MEGLDVMVMYDMYLVKQSKDGPPIYERIGCIVCAKIERTALEVTTLTDEEGKIVAMLSSDIHYVPYCQSPTPSNTY